jgi:hypothetical protein
VVEFVEGESAMDAAAKEAIEKTLDFYIREHRDEDKWAYLVRYATSTEANLYSTFTGATTPRTRRN